MSLPIKTQHRHIARLQAGWRGNALRDAKYNIMRAQAERKAGNNVLAAGYMIEYHWDMQWRNRRGRIASRERRLGK